jgi:hypothetical protein
LTATEGRLRQGKMEPLPRDMQKSIFRKRTSQTIKTPRPTFESVRNTSGVDLGLVDNGIESNVLVRRGQK